MKQVGQADLESGKFWLTERQIISLRVYKIMVITIAAYPAVLYMQKIFILIQISPLCWWQIH